MRSYEVRTVSLCADKEWNRTNVRLAVADLGDHKVEQTFVYLDKLYILVSYEH